MIKTLDFGSQKVNFNTAFAWTFAYKSQFHQDPAKILIPIIKDINDVNEKEAKDGNTDNDQDASDLAYALYEKLGFTGIAEIAWSMAKIAKQNIPDPLTWIESFGDEFPMADIVTDLIPEAIFSCFTSKKSSVPIPEEMRKKAPTQK